MESHSEFAAGKFLTKEGKVHHIKQWEELTIKLNRLSSGTQKSTKQWQTVWRDMKSTASKKASKLRNERQRTGNFPVTAQPLSTMDQRVIACMGLEYVQGSVNCPDSTPEEEEHQQRLERGETDVLDYTPTTTSIEDIFVDSYVPPTFEENETESMEREDAVGDELDYNDVVNICRQRNVEDISATEGNSQTIPASHRRRAEENQRNRRQQSGVQQQEARENVNDEPCSNNVINPRRQRNVEDIFAAEENIAPNSQTTSAPSRRRAEEIQRNRRHRQRIGVQLQEARENFGDIAEKHAEALKLFAEASMKMAENDSQRVQLENQRLEIEEKRIVVEGQIHKLLSILLDKIE
ncbi:uncharacterized protein LOC112457648 [Temnothorax curvispinosus]|uniref:Regulatory protein zeste n=1 Tax=Temnothorax curvispinosus TaxID=300111 RepID=A0A6J1Q341_9HYME|nr:uncharacterized protein LOC112457648 [Temnothorax curvispinosus]